MAISTTENEEAVALIDTSTGVAFGPTFATNGEAEGFLEWLGDQAREEYAFEFKGETIKYLADPRRYTTAELDQVIRLFREEEEDQD